MRAFWVGRLGGIGLGFGVALGVATIMAPAGAAGDRALRLASVHELRGGSQPALVVRVAGTGSRMASTVSVYIGRGHCAQTSTEERALNPSRGLSIPVQGRFDETQRFGEIPRQLWSVSVCAYLENLAGATLARDGHLFRIATYLNPVYDAPLPDPMVLRVRHRDYYAYGTGTERGFPVLHSSDLVSWRRVATAFAKRPPWVARTGDWNDWAPSVIREARPCRGATAGPCFVMYYSGLNRVHKYSCIGVATAPRPDGPFADHGILQEVAGIGPDSSGLPIGCGDAAGDHNIDPDPFVDADGHAYLYLSTGASCSPAPVAPPCRWRPTISVLPLSADLRHATGARIPLFSGSLGTWEQAPWAPVVEGPWMVRRGSRYFLFYSGGAWNGRYGMGYATAPSPVGPFTKAPTNPLLTDTSRVRSVGGGSLVTGPSGGTWVVYHGRSRTLHSPRVLRIDGVLWNRQGLPSIVGPTVAPEAPVP